MLSLILFYPRQLPSVSFVLFCSFSPLCPKEQSSIFSFSSHNMSHPAPLPLHYCIQQILFTLFEHFVVHFIKLYQSILLGEEVILFFFFFPLSIQVVSDIITSVGKFELYFPQHFRWYRPRSFVENSCFGNLYPCIVVK